MSATRTQELLFQRIRELVPPQLSLVDRVAEILFISSDSAYRRIRGETLLVLDEAAELCRVFGLSLDNMLSQQAQDIQFRNVRISNQHLTYYQFLQGLYEQISVLEACGSKEIIYMSKDLPLFHNFYFRPLIAFRYFFWMKTHLVNRDFENLKFSFDLLPPEVETLSRKITTVYSRIPSTEMWNTESINSTISQIEFSRDAGHFSNADDLRIIYQSLEDTIEHIKTEAELGQKFMPGEPVPQNETRFRFFYNRVVLGDNTIMVKADTQRTVYINYGHLNYLQTAHPAFCEELLTDFDNLIRRSTLISQTGERQRHIFFNILFQKIRARQ